MKRIIITTLILLTTGLLIGSVLISNKNANEAKTAVVSQASGAVAVTGVPVSKQPIRLDFSANGTFSANQELQLLSETNGRITRILVNEGSRVAQGQVLAIVDAEVVSLDVQRAEDTYSKMKTDYERYQSSFATGGVTQAQLDDIELSLRNAESQLQQARRRLNDANIKAPIAGVINKRFIEVGSFVSPGKELFEIVDASRLKLNVHANEFQVVNIRVGDKVAISSKVMPEVTFVGTVNFIAEKSDNTLNFPVEILLENGGRHAIKPGMYATARFEFPENKPQIVVHRNAFVGSVNSNQVYILAEAARTAQLRQVVSGRVIGEYVEILSGLDEGEIVITSGQINLADGVEVSANIL